MANDITAEEYKKFLDERERIKQAMEDAQSEFLFITYKKLLSILNNRYEQAVKLNIQLENRETRQKAAEKRESLKNAAKSA